MKIICGVDVSKARLDACIEPGAIFASFDNDTAGIAALAAFCRQHQASLVVMEATGGYERRAFLLLWEAGMPCALTNPRSVRRYAESMGILEKTDRIDASVIARFAHAKNLQPTPAPTPAQQRLKALVARLRQVTDDLTVQKQRRASLADNAEMLASVDEVIALLKRQSRRLEGEIASMIDDDPLWAQLAEAWRSVKGVAGRTIARLMADLPEIGTYSNKAIAKLAGLAPIADDSGKRKGKRSIRGGRASSLQENTKWPSGSLWPTNCSSASTQKHAMRVPNTPMQLDSSDSRSPQPSPTEVGYIRLRQMKMANSGKPELDGRGSALPISGHRTNTPFNFVTTSAAPRIAQIPGGRPFVRTSARDAGAVVCGCLQRRTSVVHRRRARYRRG